MPLNKPQFGFTLLEVMVAIVVLSLGLLGLAGLQAASLRNNQTAYYRGIATQQAYDMADRLRANLAGVRAGNYNALALGIPADPGCFTTAAGCSPSTMAATDRFQWNTVNAALLPNGNGTVVCEGGGPGVACTAATGNRVFNITVTWTERTEAGSGAQSFITRVSP
ncbi:MAG: type IV pilus modification protein PilV [Thiobacillus sp.]|nr:type IV pilus modification protein PilV [Thiobacillus sp.]